MPYLPELMCWQAPESWADWQRPGMPPASSAAPCQQLLRWLPLAAARLAAAPGVLCSDALVPTLE